MKLLLSLLLLSISYGAIAQRFLDLTFGLAAGSSTGVATFYSTFNLAQQDIDGSPFLTEQWEQGKIITPSDYVTEIDSMMFNVYDNKLVFNYKGKVYFLNEGLKIKEFVLGERKFLNLSLSKNGAEYYEEVYGGKHASLLKKYKCDFLPGKVSNGMIPGTNDKYMVKSNYYLKDNADQSVKIKTNKSSVLSYCELKRSLVKTYIKENKLKFKNESDLITVIKYYDSLF